MYKKKKESVIFVKQMSEMNVIIYWNVNPNL